MTSRRSGNSKSSKQLPLSLFTPRCSIINVLQCKRIILYHKVLVSYSSSNASAWNELRKSIYCCENHKIVIRHYIFWLHVKSHFITHWFLVPVNLEQLEKRSNLTGIADVFPVLLRAVIAIANKLIQPENRVVPLLSYLRP